MSKRLEGRRALVWGGGTGLGYACAEAMAAEGARVFLTGRRAEKLEAARARLPQGAAAVTQGDITREEDVLRVTRAAADFLGGLDVVVTSSGTSSRGSIFDATAEDFRKLIDLNVTGTFLAVRHASDLLVASGNGAVVAIASTTAITAMRERVAYAASKSAVLGMVRAMALDFASKGVRVNAISPSLVMTELAHEILSREADPKATLASRKAQHPMGRLGEPADVGRACVYLASSESGWMTGQNIVLDGGMTIV